MTQKNNKKYEVYKIAKRTVKNNWGIIGKQWIKKDGMLAVLDEDVKIAWQLSWETLQRICMGK